MADESKEGVGMITATGKEVKVDPQEKRVVGIGHARPGEVMEIIVDTDHLKADSGIVIDNKNTFTTEKPDLKRPVNIKFLNKK